MNTKGRHYIISTLATPVALIKADNRPQALRYWAERQFSAKLASQDELVDLLTVAGLRVENATKGAQERARAAGIVGAPT